MTTDEDAKGDQLRAVLAAAGASGSWDWDIIADRLYFDPRFAELYGLEGKDFPGGVPTSTFYRAIHPEDRKRIKIAVAGMLAGAELFSKEFRVVDPAGNILWMHGRGQSLRNERDEPIRFTGLLVDVTERKRAEERLRIAQTAGHIGTFEYRDGFATVSVSDEFCRLLGFHPADRLPVRTINSAILEGSPPFIPEGSEGEAPGTLDGEFQIRRGDDQTVRWIARRGEVLRDTVGMGYRLLGAIYDVTEAKAQEMALRAINDSLEERAAQTLAEKKVYVDVVETSPAAVTVLDLEYNILAINQANADAFERAFGKRPQVGDKFLEFFSQDPEGLAQQKDIWSRALTGETYVMTGEFGQGEKERRWFEVRFSPLRDRAGNLIGASSSSYDITDRVLYEAQLERAQEQLRQAQKMEAVGQLTGGIAHDFNNLLTVIMGSIEIAARRLEPAADPRLRRSLENALKGAESAATLVHRLLAFSRQQPLNPAIIDVPRLLAGMSDLLSRTITEAIAVAIDAPDDLWRIEADHNQLENAILNLAVNARDAMPEGGSLTIEARETTVSHDAPVEGLKPGEYITIAVIDTGVGMDAETLAKVFDPFFTTKEVGKGTGLGLSMVYGFASQSRGGVTVSSEPGKGTRVSLFLPRAIALTENEQITEAGGAEKGDLSETILVVEDDDDVRAYTVSVLRELGYRVIEAHDGESGLRLLERQEQPVSLLVTDVIMPKMSGHELALAAQAVRPYLRVLFTSGYTRDAIAHNGRLDPGIELLAKPFTFKALASKVREVLDRV